MPINHLAPPTGNMADNVVGFARALRAAGIPVGPGAVIDALNALQVIEIGNRADVYTTLEAIFVKRHEHALIFKQAFELFFRAAEDWKHMLDSVPLPDHAKKKPPPASRRVQEAMAQPAMREELPQAELVTRRHQPDPRGLRLDMRRTIRRSLRTSGEIIDIRKLGRIEKPAPIVALLDISGSMSEYTRLFLHSLHAITDHRKRVSVFLFGTRLTNVTRALRAKDPDEALASCSQSVEDWAGGTRIATSLHTFNKLWARRVLGQGAIVLLISDGLEREADDKLAFEMDRLHRSC